MSKNVKILLEMLSVLSLCIIGAFSIYFFSKAVYKEILKSSNESSSYIQTGPNSTVDETQKTAHKVENIHFPFRTSEGLMVEINFNVFRSIETTKYDRAEITGFVMNYFYKYSWEEISEDLEFHSINIEKGVKRILGNDTTVTDMKFLSSRPF